MFHDQTLFDFLAYEEGSQRSYFQALRSNFGNAGGVLALGSHIHK
jgi:hypothetical protein